MATSDGSSPGFTHGGLTEEAGNAVRAAVLLDDDSPLREAVDNLSSEDPAQRAGAIELIDSSQEAVMLRPLISVLEGKDDL